MENFDCFTIFNNLDSVHKYIFYIAVLLYSPFESIDFEKIQEYVDLIFMCSPSISHGVFHYLTDELNLRSYFSEKFLDKYDNM